MVILNLTISVYLFIIIRIIVEYGIWTRVEVYYLFELKYEIKFEL